MSSQRFQATWAGSYRRLFVLGFWILCAIFILIVEPFILSPVYNSRHPEDAKSMLWIRIAMISLVCLYVLPRIIVPMIREFWMSSFTVEVTDAQIAGLNLWKKKTVIALEEVEEIEPELTLPIMRATTTGLDLVTTKGTRLRLHPNIEPFGECVEYIRARCPNLRKVNYGGLDDNLRIWSGTHKF